MDSILGKIEQLERAHDQPDPALLSKYNIKLGLRNADGTGVFVGLTSKGMVVGYEKVPRDGAGPDPAVLANLHLPGLPQGTHASPAMAIYYLLHGRLPTEPALQLFESKLVELREYEVRPVPGRLYYCGYDVVTLVRRLQQEHRPGFEEVAFLLLTGELPSARDLTAFTQYVTERRALPEAMRRLVMYESANADQMNALHRAVSALSLFDGHPNPTKLSEITRQCVDVLAKIPTIVAYNYQALAFSRGHSKGLLPPKPEYSLGQNFLYLLHGREPTPLEAELMDLCLILHAEHGGGNNSTFAVRVVSSSQANTYMALTSGIASLSGHLHGGANEAVMRMMLYVKDSVKDWADEGALRAYLSRVLQGQAADHSGKIYGLGHAVYTLSDPRAVVLEEKAEMLAEQASRLDEFRLYQRVARIGCELLLAQKGKRVAPNVDFYSGFVYDAMGIPVEIFTPIFAMARVAGWSAHRLEQLFQSKIIRPSFVSSQKPREYVPLAAR